jgi:hypothetical protein
VDNKLDDFLDENPNLYVKVVVLPTPPRNPTACPVIQAKYLKNRKTKSEFCKDFSQEEVQTVILKFISHSGTDQMTSDDQ